MRYRKQLRRRNRKQSIDKLFITYYLILFILPFFQPFGPLSKSQVICRMNSNSVETTGSISFSVIMAVHNKEKHIVRSLDSCLNQSFQDFELLCIDDKSSDKSANIILDYAKKYKVIRPILFKENKGTFYVRQYGIRNSNNPYIFMLDPDDAFANGILQHVYEILSIRDYEIVDFKANQLKRGRILRFPQNYRPPNNISMKRVQQLFVKDKLYRNIIFRCIKKSLYIKALDFLGDEVVTRFIVCSEDYLLFCVCLIFLQSIYFSTYVGYIYSMVLPDSITNSKKSLKLCTAHNIFCENIINHIIKSDFSEKTNISEALNFTVLESF